MVPYYLPTRYVGTYIAYIVAHIGRRSHCGRYGLANLELKIILQWRLWGLLAFGPPNAWLSLQLS
jgi:hypothetical protein